MRAVNMQANPTPSARRRGERQSRLTYSFVIPERSPFPTIKKQIFKFRQSYSTVFPIVSHHHLPGLIPCYLGSAQHIIFLHSPLFAVMTSSTHFFNISFVTQSIHVSSMGTKFTLVSFCEILDG